MDLHTNHPRERELLLLAAHTDADPAGRARIEQLLAENIDRTDLVRLAIQHRLVPLLNARLLPIGAPRVPSDITQALGVWSERNRDHNQVNAQTSTEISTALQEQGIDAAFLNGPVVARLAYGNLHLQEAVNPALLLRPPDLDRFQVLLKAHGYVSQTAQAVSAAASPAAENASHRTYTRVEDGSTMEAHTAVIPAAHGITLDIDDLLERAVDYDIGGMHVRALSLEDLVLVLCVAGGTREWAVVGDLCDVAWLLRSHPDIDIQAVRSRAKAEGVERLLLLGLGLAQQVLGLHIDAALNFQGEKSAQQIPGTIPERRAIAPELALSRCQQRSWAAPEFAVSSGVSPHGWPICCTALCAG